MIWEVFSSFNVSVILWTQGAEPQGRPHSPPPMGAAPQDAKREGGLPSVKMAAPREGACTRPCVCVRVYAAAGSAALSKDGGGRRRRGSAP